MNYSSNVVTYQQATQAAVHLDSDMLAHCLSDAKISLFNKALGKYIAPFKIKPNHDPLQVAYCLHQMEVAVHSAAVAADIPARMLDSVAVRYSVLTTVSWTSLRVRMDASRLRLTSVVFSRRCRTLSPSSQLLVTVT